MIWLTPKPSQIVYRIQSKEKSFFFFFFFFFLQKKTFLRKRRSEGLDTKRKDSFLTTFAKAILKDLTTPIKKHANELKVNEKTVKTAIK